MFRDLTLWLLLVSIFVPSAFLSAVRPTSG